MEQSLQKRVVKNKVVPVHPPSHPTNVLQALHYFPKQKYCCCCSTTGTYGGADSAADDTFTTDDVNYPMYHGPN
eukprot:scaffold23778_cov158-Skeletonema_marinoi.AAC.3